MKIRFIFLISLLQLLPMTAMAQVEKSKDRRTFTFYLENDAFTETDRGYTSGIRLALISRDLTHYRKNPDLPEWSDHIIKWLPLVNEPGFQRSISMSIGQNIYTPEDVGSSELIEEDRPYAGVTYLGIGFHSKSSSRMDTLEFDLGAVGPQSNAEESQKVVHEWMDNTQPNGWDNQLKDETVLGVFYERKWKLLQSGVGSGLGYDIIPRLGGGLGNLYTYACTGAEVRFGWNLPNDFGTFLIRPGADASAALDERDPRYFRHTRFGIHFFAAVDGQAVMRNIFLDGNTIEDSHRVDKKPFVADFMAGLGVIVGPFKVSYAYAYRTKEFETQKNDQVFGSITFSVSF